MPSKKRDTVRKGKVSKSKQDGLVIGSASDVDADTSTKAKRKQKASDDDFLAAARTTWKEIADSPNEIKNRTSALVDLKFYVGGTANQWPPDVVQRLTARRRPVLTVNRIKPAVRQTVGAMMQDRPGIKVLPVDDYADIRTAEIIQGIIRHVEVNSEADVAYDMMLKPQTIHGRGYCEIEVDYPNPFSMDQEAFISPIEDPFSVYLGPCRKVDGSDRNDAFIIYDYSPSQYCQEFPDSELAGLNDFTTVGATLKGWGSKNFIRVAKYFYRKFTKTTLVKFKDGRVLRKDQIPEQLANTLGIVEERETDIPEVYVCLMNAKEKLRETRFPSMYIPVVECTGDKDIVDGVMEVMGIVRDAQDAQRQFNYFRSRMTEKVALESTAPFIMAEGQDENHTAEWNNANIENFSVLRYKPVTVAGQLAPPPQRNFAEPSITSYVQASIQYEEDIKATTQVYDATLGAKSNEVSGRAIQQRKMQSTVGNYIFPNNFLRSLRTIGKILLNIIPNIYDARDVARIIGLDDKAAQVQIINDASQPAYNEKQDGDAIKKIYNLGVGQYDISLSTGPGYMSERAESFDMLTKMVNSYPELMKVAGDIIFAKSDIPGAQEISKRMKLAMPPELIDDGPQAVPPKVQRAMKQMTMLIQVQGQKLQELTEQMKSKQAEFDNKINLEKMRESSNEHIAAMNVQVQAYAVAAKAQSEKTDKLLSMLELVIGQVNQPGPAEMGAGV